MIKLGGIEFLIIIIPFDLLYPFFPGSPLITRHVEEGSSKWGFMERSLKGENTYPQTRLKKDGRRRVLMDKSKV